MNLTIPRTDYLKVFSSTKQVVEKSRFVHINADNLDKISAVIKSRIDIGLGTPEENFAIPNNLNDAVQFIFLQDSVNFCFWPEKNRKAWQIEWPMGNLISGGWYNLRGCFERAMAENVGILNAEFLEKMDKSQVESFFRGFGDETIPLIEKRKDIFNQTGSVLMKKYSGKIINLLEEANFDSLKIIRLVLKDFISYRDMSTYDNLEVVILKRAQILVNDLSYLSQTFKDFKLSNTDFLSAFADYKLPQVLRDEGVLIYEDSLAQRVDNMELIAADSPEEVEIRSATIWAVELIRQKLANYSSGQIDNAIWLISQDQSKIKKPHHRTYSIYY